MTVSRANAKAFASSVLPQPGGPSIRTGFLSSPVMYTWVSVTSSTMNLASWNFWRSSSIDGNTFACTLSQDSTGRCGFRRKTRRRCLGGVNRHGQIQQPGRDSRNFEQRDLKVQVSKLWQNRERLHSGWQHFSQVHDALSRSVTEELSRLSQVVHAQR